MTSIQRLKKELMRFRKLFSGKSPTRGHGLLEFHLSAQRAAIAKKIIAEKNKHGKILDIGCGNYPIFLLTLNFFKKYAIEQTSFASDTLNRRITLQTDLSNKHSFDLDSGGFDVVTMLAVLEHIEKDQIRQLLSELHTMLKPGGIVVITIPSPWAETILRILAALSILSKNEIDDHKSVLHNQEIRSLLSEAGFGDIEGGYFEMFCNRWFVATKK